MEDKKKILLEIKKGTKNLKLLPESLKKDKDVVIELLKSGESPIYMDQTLKDDKEFISKLIKLFPVIDAEDFEYNLYKLDVSNADSISSECIWNTSKEYNFVKLKTFTKLKDIVVNIKSKTLPIIKNIFNTRTTEYDCEVTYETFDCENGFETDNKNLENKLNKHFEEDKSLFEFTDENGFYEEETNWIISGPMSVKRIGF